jgi:hypothetical protein
MAIEILKKIRRHAAVARGDFATLIKDVKIPPLPAAVNRLIAEINRSEPNIDRLVLEAILFNRIIGGLPYPLWRADPKIARSFGAMAGIPESETTFWRQLATKTLQRRGS